MSEPVVVMVDEGDTALSDKPEERYVPYVPGSLRLPRNAVTVLITEMIGLIMINGDYHEPYGPSLQEPVGRGWSRLPTQGATLIDS